MTSVLSCVWQVLLDWFTNEPHKVDAPEALQVGSMTAFPSTREFEVDFITRSGELEIPNTGLKGSPELVQYAHVKPNETLKTPNKRVKGQSRHESIPTTSMMAPNGLSGELPQKEGHPPTQTKLPERSLIINARPLKPLSFTSCILQGGEEKWQNVTGFDIEKFSGVEMDTAKCANDTVDIIPILISSPLDFSTVPSPDLSVQQSDPVIVEDIKSNNDQSRPNNEQFSAPPTSSSWMNLSGNRSEKTDWKRLEERTNLSLKGVKETLGLETLWCENLDDDELPPIPQSWFSDVIPDAETTHHVRPKDDDIHFVRPMPLRKKVIYNTYDRR